METRVDDSGYFKIVNYQTRTENYQLKPFPNFYLLLNPGDSLHIRFNLDTVKGISFSGDGAEENKLLNNYYLDGYFGAKSAGFQEVSTTDPDLFKKNMDSLLQYNQNQIAKYDSIHPLSPLLKKIIKGHIYNNYYENLYQYGFSNCSVLNQPKSMEATVDDSYKFFQFVNDFKNDISILTGHSAIEKTMDAYQYYFFQTHFPQIPTRDIFKDSDSDSTVIHTILAQEKNKECKQYMLSRYANNMLESGDIQSFNSYYNLLKTNINADHLWYPIEKKYHALMSEDSIPALPDYDIQMINNDSLRNLLSDFIGAASEVVYIDIWNTACLPCIKDILESKPIISKEYLGKEISFIYLCTGVSRTAFEEFVAENQLVGTHIYLEKEQSLALHSHFDIWSNPFQVIVDRSGNVVKAGSQYRLYSSVTKHIINKLLSQSTS